MPNVPQLLSAVLLACLSAACHHDVPCVTQGAAKDKDGVCGCPAGMREVALKPTESICVSDDAGTAAGDAGQASGAAPDAASGAADGGRNLDASVLDASPSDSGQLLPADTGTPDSSSMVEQGPPACIPTAEVCDHKDNNCNGVTDEGVANACGGCDPIDPAHAVGMACSNGGTGACDLPGAYGCLGGTTVCSAPPPTPSVEVCDGKDNNCNGMVDEGVANACGGCGVLENAKDSVCSNMQKGECAATGVYVCSPDKTATVCSAPMKTGSIEVCDGKDNNCNGMVDEGVQTVWYADCDADGAAVLAGSVTSCAKPPPSGTCKAYLATMPTGALNTPGSTIDCNDLAAAYHPGAQFAVAGDGNGDLNCDGQVEKKTVFIASSPPTAPRTEFPICSDPVWRTTDTSAVGPCNCYRPGWFVADFGSFVPNSTSVLDTAGQRVSSNMSLSIPGENATTWVFPAKLDCSRLPNEATELLFFSRTDPSASCTSDNTRYAVRQLCQ